MLFTPEFKKKRLSSMNGSTEVTKYTVFDGESLNQVLYGRDAALPERSLTRLFFSSATHLLIGVFPTALV